MSKIIDFKPIFNKKNKQLMLSVPKKKMPPHLKKMLKDNPSKIKIFKMKFEGFE